MEKTTNRWINQRKNPALNSDIFWGKFPPISFPKASAFHELCCFSRVFRVEAQHPREASHFESAPVAFAASWRQAKGSSNQNDDIYYIYDDAWSITHDLSQKICFLYVFYKCYILFVWSNACRVTMMITVIQITCQDSHIKTHCNILKVLNARAFECWGRLLDSKSRGERLYWLRYSLDLCLEEKRRNVMNSKQG